MPGEGSGPMTSGTRATKASGQRRFMLAAVGVLLAFALAVPAEGAGGEIFQIGGTVVVPRDRVVGGDVVAIGGPVEVFGIVRGDVVALGGHVIVHGTVFGDVVAVGGNVTVRPGARVDGDVTLVGGSLHRDEGAFVGGRVSQVQVMGDLWHHLPRYIHVVWPPATLGANVLYVLGLLTVALAVTALFPRQVYAVARSMEKNAGRAIMIGLIGLLSLVPLTLLLTVTIVGPFVLWAFFFAAKFMGYVAAVALIGGKVAAFFMPSPRPLPSVAFGVAAVALLRYVPVFGWLFSGLLTAWSFGAVLDTKFGTNQPWIPPRVDG